MHYYNTCYVGMPLRGYKTIDKTRTICTSCSRPMKDMPASYVRRVLLFLAYVSDRVHSGVFNTFTSYKYFSYYKLFTVQFPLINFLMFGIRTKIIILNSNKNKNLVRLKRGKWAHVLLDFCELKKT